MKNENEIGTDAAAAASAGAAASAAASCETTVGLFFAHVFELFFGCDMM